MDFENNGVELENPAEIKPNENVLMGFVGALIGAILGGASIILMSRLGYIASICGFILAFCTVKGYQLLGKGFGKAGMVICAVLILATPFLADWIDWAILIMESWADYGVTFMEAFLVAPELLADGTIEMAEYLKNLGMIYLFAVIGAISTLRKAYTGK